MTFRVIKPRTAVRIMIYFGITCVALPIIAWLADASLYIVILVAISTSWIICYFTYACIIKRIVIGTGGVEYRAIIKRYKISWDDIKVVGIGYYLAKAPGRPPLIYFTTEDISFPLLTKGLYKSDKYIIAHYRKKMITEISKYWTKQIDGIHFVDGKKK